MWRGLSVGFGGSVQTAVLLVGRFEALDDVMEATGEHVMEKPLRLDLVERRYDGIQPGGVGALAGSDGLSETFDFDDDGDHQPDDDDDNDGGQEAAQSDAQALEAVGGHEGVEVAISKVLVGSVLHGAGVHGGGLGRVEGRVFDGLRVGRASVRHGCEV